jgi:putative two-component system response regulator
MELASLIARGHHERWDGKGYPQGEAGENIPLAARITSVSDVYDALRSERPYKRAWSHDEAMKELFRNKGTQFDPELIDVFSACSDCIERIYRELPD